MGGCISINRSENTNQNTSTNLSPVTGKWCNLNNFSMNSYDLIETVSILSIKFWLQEKGKTEFQFNITSFKYSSIVSPFSNHFAYT